MLRITGKLTPLRGQFRLLPVSQVNLEKVRQLTSGSSNFKNSNSDGRKEGYQEREICLLFDMRTPLPGNNGIPPSLLKDRNVIRKLPPTVGRRLDLISVPSPEERYNSVCTQAVVQERSEILFSSKNIEFKGYTCPELLKQDFKDLFPHKDLRGEHLTVITLCLKTETDMSAWSEASEAERGKHEQFFQIAACMILEHLISYHRWVEFVHPTTGKLTTRHNISPKTEEVSGPATNATMYQTDMRYAKLGLTIEDLGCCRIISHPKWGTNVFNGAIFTNANVNSVEVQALLNKIFLRGLYIYKQFYEL